MLYAEKDLSELLICKEQELKELQARQIHFQETTLQETRKQLQEMHRKFNSLKEDFTYNLKVLEERDKELEHYDTLFIQLKMVENTNQAEASDLRIQELLVAIDTEIKEREHDFRVKADEMSNLVLSHELKVKLLTKELEALKEAGMKAADSLKVAEAANMELEKQDLESKLASVQLGWEKEKETFERKHATIDHFAREKEAVIVSMKQAHVEQTHRWKNQIQKLQTNKETLEMKLDQAEYRFVDQLREKESIIEKSCYSYSLCKTELYSRRSNLPNQTFLQI
ncbi:hypothetical protein E2320_015898 [Naja naja]|nr:hypothetical protein E2320_015898 [Naja naja]